MPFSCNLAGSKFFKPAVVLQQLLDAQLLTGQVLLDHLDASLTNWQMRSDLVLTMPLLPSKNVTVSCIV